ncbi:MAG: sigma 54-interacting transcriptional regulator [Halioglobus sp.]
MMSSQGYASNAKGKPYRQDPGGLIKNQLLCFWQQGSEGNNITDKVIAAGWQVHSADSLALVNSLSRRHRMPIGLLFIGSHLTETELEEAYQGISATDDMVWLALLTDGRRMSDEVCNLIATHCHDFFTPPYDCRRILDALGHTAGMARIQHRSQELRTAPVTFHGMIGESQAMRRFFRQIRKVARAEAPVLLTGESGCGKELAANAIHRLCQRANMPFVAVNCAALPGSLIQAELFGHEKGAFTGAEKRRVGRLEAAHGGVLFLDEISDMPLDQQVTLLRFLEDRRIERLGGSGNILLDVRVIAATHDNLEERCHAGQFREDLFHRLNVLRLEIPPLRERGTDITLLANHVLEKYAHEYQDNQIKGFDRQARAAMNAHYWPGNVRELVNRVRGAMVLAEGNFIGTRDLSLSIDINSEYAQTLETSRTESDRHCIEAALLHNRNNMTTTAKELGISRTTLYRIMDKLEIQA